MNKNKLIGIVSSILLIISVWLPYTKALGIGVTLFTGPAKILGIIVLLVGLVNAILIGADKKGTKITAIVLGSLMLIISALMLGDLITEPRTGVSLGISAFLIPITCLGIIVSGIMGLKKNKVNPAIA